MQEWPWPPSSPTGSGMSGRGGAVPTQLNEEDLRKIQTSETSHLAVEALRRLVEQKMREVTRHNTLSWPSTTPWPTRRWARTLMSDDMLMRVPVRWSRTSA